MATTAKLPVAEAEAAPEGRVPDWVAPHLFPFQSRHLEAAGHRFHYFDEGSGPTLLLVHPGPSWALYYRELVLALRLRFRCVVPDLPGFGLSQAAAGYRFSLPEHAEALGAFVAALGLDDVALLLHDSGGPIGLGLAVREPERVPALVLTSTFGWPLTDYPHVRRMLRLVTGPLVAPLANRFNLLPRAVARLAPRRRRLSPDERRALEGAFPTPVERQRILTLFRDLVERVGYLEEIETGLRARLARRPALLMYGEVDPARRFGFDARFARLLPRHRRIVIRGEQHFAHLAAADEMARHVVEFWDAVEAGSL